jgi:glycosyltransferase involved in cell wall biosynthesis
LGRTEKCGESWQYPKVPLGPAILEVAGPATDLADMVFLPMADWHAGIQRSQQLAMAFARAGHRCIYVNPHLGRELPGPPLASRKPFASVVAENVIEFHLPLRREPVYHHRLLRNGETRELFGWIAKALELIQSNRQVVISSFPIWTGVARLLRDKLGSVSVYDCHDLLEGFHDVAPEISAQERESFSLADTVLFSADWLAAQKLSEGEGFTSRHCVVRNAVAAEDFPFDAGRTAGAQGSSSQKTVGYVGALNSWFDVEAVDLAARSHPGWRFLLVGKVASPKIEPLRHLPNVTLVGEVPYEELPMWLDQFDVATIPFLVQPLTLATNPVKLYEYFACGLPVVSAPLPEVQRYAPLAYTAANPSQFVGQLEAACAENDFHRRSERRRIAETESWQLRCRTILDACKAAERQSSAGRLP